MFGYDRGIVCSSAATALPPTSYSAPGDLSVDPFHDTHKVNSGEELRVANGNLPDKDKRRHLEFDIRRPSSRKDSIRGFNSRGYFDRDSLEQPLQSARDGQLPPATKYGQFRPMGVRNNFLSGQQIPQQRAPQPPPPTTCRSEQDDLVAMGTNWNSLNSHRGGRSFTNGGSTIQMLQGGSPARKVGSRSSITGLNGNCRNHCNKDFEPRYPDPFIGAPHGFQQRIAELASLEAETIRKEKSNKAKKKAKADKDS
ncbi:hypothetical protein LSAT2_025671 [Lamellibrachia satsuma]|nr:hypothetical protein LSAT2_025671 [Lamellibrachia satsuma]